MKIDGIWFKDDEGRRLILRGANLSGATKVPVTPNGATYRSEGFFNGRDVSFVGRPFPLDEADEHFTRLKAWGMTFLRLLITWEAIEHAGPRQYDEAYLDYLRAVVQKAGEHGIDVFIDPHQDVWSRWTGGDGAPSWTFDAVGIDIAKLHTTGAAINHQTHGDPFPRMIWPSNYSRLGAGTMFTLFFGGNDFAPATQVDGVPVQEYLQGHYIDAVKQVAERLKDLPNVVGYDSLNEPGPGYLGIQDVGAPYPGLLQMGPMPTPFQSMLLASGYPQDVPVFEMGFEGAKQVDTVRINPNSVSLWKSGYTCVWKQNGVWDDAGGSPVVLRADHFARKPDGSAVDPIHDYMKPFMIRFIHEIRQVDPRAFLFLEGAPATPHPKWGPDDPGNAVNAAHWYDSLTLFLKTFSDEFTVDIETRQPVFGPENVQALFVQQLAHVKDANIPTVVGEFGVPFDLDDKSAYRSGDFSVQTAALDMYYNAMDANLLNCTIWNYTPDNSNERGDLWNDEDLSIFSRDQQDKPWQDDVHAGGRGLNAIVRPYARRTAGDPVSMHFDLHTRRFEFTYRPDPAVTAPTEIFVPSFQYPNGVKVDAGGGTFDYDADAQVLRVTAPAGPETHTVVVTSA
ncbi:MAG: cellulase family glycosylhydrolase [Chloroflexi bacterium]|nr:cellulase family glycosylhydrolase [Chloroflexota bacterium]